MRKVYLIVLGLVLSSLATVTYTFNQVKTDKEKFMAKVEKVFEGQDEISDGANNTVYLEYRELIVDKDSIIINKANNGKGVPTAIATPLISGYYYLVLKKEIQEDKLTGFTLDSISSYNLFYRGVVDRDFQKNFRVKFSVFTQNCYQKTLEKHLQTEIPGKVDHIVEFGKTKTDYYFLKKMDPYKKKHEEFYTYSCNGSDMTLFFGSDRLNYTVTQNNKKILSEGLLNLLLSITGISILFLIIFLIVKIIKKEHEYKK